MFGRVGVVGVGVAVTLMWASSWLLVRWGDDRAIDPVAFAALRYSVAAAVLLAAASCRPRQLRSLLGDPSAMRRIVPLGVVYYGITQAAQFVAIVNQPAATTSLMLSGTAFVVCVLAAVVLGERITCRTAVGGVLLVLGTAVYMRGDLGATGVGLAASVVALGGNSVAMLLGRAVNRAGVHPPLAVTSVSMTVGAAFLLGCMALTGRSLPLPTWPVVALVAWLAVVNTAVAFTLWSWVLRHLSATRAASINNLMLIEIAVLGWMFLGERPGAVDAVGLAIVSAAIVAATRSPATSRAQRVPAPTAFARGSQVRS